PARFFQPTEPVAFAASVDPEKPLGCDLSALPPASADWQAVAYDRAATGVPDAPADARPDLPAAEGDPYVGENLDLNRARDLGASLAGKKLGKTVVLHLSGSDQKPTSPIRVRNADLVLYFEPPRDDKAPPLALTHTDQSGEALVEVENGSLTV